MTTSFSSAAVPVLDPAPPDPVLLSPLSVGGLTAFADGEIGVLEVEDDPVVRVAGIDCKQLSAVLGPNKATLGLDNRLGPQADEIRHVMVRDLVGYLDGFVLLGGSEGLLRPWLRSGCGNWEGSGQ